VLNRNHRFKYPLKTVGECAIELDVPAESIQDLVDAGDVPYTINRQFYTCVDVDQVRTKLASKAERILLGPQVQDAVVEVNGQAMHLSDRGFWDYAKQ
jgi:hypothetical protein